MDGYEFFGDRQLVTIFSAPSYCGQFDNAAAVMSVDEQLVGVLRCSGILLLLGLLLYNNASGLEK